MGTRFLNLAELLEIHRDQLSKYGGEPGIRDLELFRSIPGMPAATFGGEFLQADLFEMAATYLVHLAKNRPFVDGNQRAGAVAAQVFLLLNGFDFQAPEVDLVVLVTAVAQGRLGKADVAVFIRRWSKEIGPPLRGDHAK